MAVLLPLQGHPDVYIWNYVPSLPASIVSSVLWFAIGALLGLRMYKTKTYFCSYFVGGCLMEVIGYCARAASTNETNLLGPYIIQSCFILLPPALFGATIYMCLSKIIRLVHGEHLSIVRPRILTWAFVLGDYLSLTIQGNAAGLVVRANTNPTLGNIGKALIIFGLAIQLISFAIFIITAILFHRRIRAAPTPRSLQVNQGWVTELYMLHGISFLIIVRSVFRIAEYVMGSHGYFLTHEWPLYAFDTAMMFGVSLIFYYFYPSNITPTLDDPILLESQNSEEAVVQSVDPARK